eukprot:1160936-Pelagomonas_calceolata.AAC.5
MREQDANIDCLSIFLAPISLDEYNKRLRAWLTESDEEVAMRMEVATQQIEAAKKCVGKKKVEGGGIVFDHMLVNSETPVLGLSRSNHTLGCARKHALGYASKHALGYASKHALGCASKHALGCASKNALGCAKTNAHKAHSV